MASAGGAASRSVLAVLGVGVVDPDTPILCADDEGVTRGDGCFEGIRVRRDGAGAAYADKLERHLARMTRSASSLGIAFDEPAWRELVRQACAAWTGDEAAMKLVLTRGRHGTGVASGFATVTPLSEDYPRQRREGIRAITLDRGLASAAFATAPWLLGGVKTLSYAVNMAAQREAERRGAQDVIFVSADGLVLEAPTGTVVWAVGHALWTTPLGATGILPGTTQQLLFERAAGAGWRTGEKLVRLDELLAADAVWITSSVRGPVELVDVDGTPRAPRPDLADEVRELSGF